MEADALVQLPTRTKEVSKVYIEDLSAPRQTMATSESSSLQMTGGLFLRLTSKWEPYLKTLERLTSSESARYYLSPSIKLYRRLFSTKPYFKCLGMDSRKSHWRRCMKPLVVTIRDNKPFFAE